eukprot:TRINITY_DN48091_c0_g1_i1.p1 TRINITY_DN48091_c0_g1~~TRINITY_DN48091_c0_g1_i1.p1  ORF type:complete len:187 (+),score=30.18 TRINITY_DN48091_c0_g1_i1:53-562(+)
MCDAGMQARLKDMSVSADQSKCLCTSCDSKYQAFIGEVMKAAQSGAGDPTSIAQALLNSPEFESLGQCASDCLHLGNLFTVGHDVAQAVATKMDKACLESLMQNNPSPQCVQKLLQVTNDALPGGPSSTSSASKFYRKTWFIVTVGVVSFVLGIVACYLVMGRKRTLSV